MIGCLQLYFPSLDCLYYELVVLWAIRAGHVRGGYTKKKCVYCEVTGVERHKCSLHEKNSGGILWEVPLAVWRYKVSLIVHSKHSVKKRDSNVVRNAATTVNLGEVQPIINCFKQRFVYVGVPGLEFMKTPRHLYGLFQGLSVCVMSVDVLSFLHFSRLPWAMSIAYWYKKRYYGRTLAHKSKTCVVFGI